jgi:hypothetical protein
MPHTSIGLWK